MRVIVVGLGVQGHKRRAIAGPDCVGVVDPVNRDATFRNLEEVPVDSYDAALLCVPDEPKPALLEYLFTHGKHALVEKPLIAEDDAVLVRLEALAREHRVVCYTAYNHRFEPHFVAMRDLIASGELGRVYTCRMFYGNGCARLVRNSPWRDQGAGVIPDLVSHLLDTVRFWFGPLDATHFDLVSADRFENASPDHAVIASRGPGPRFQFEVTLLSWRNHFTCDILAEKGSAHISSLCKWGPSTFTHRRRILPSGRPPERDATLVQDDPTWAAEYAHFRGLCEGRATSDLSADRWVNRTLAALSAFDRERVPTSP